MPVGHIGTWCIAEIWESQQAFDHFIDERLLPAMREIGGPEPARREAFVTYHAGPSHPVRVTLSENDQSDGRVYRSG